MISIKRREEFHNEDRGIKKGGIEKPCAKDLPLKASEAELSKVQKAEVGKAAKKCLNNIDHSKLFCTLLCEMLKTKKNIS